MSDWTDNNSSSRLVRAADLPRSPLTQLRRLCQASERPEVLLFCGYGLRQTRPYRRPSCCSILSASSPYASWRPTWALGAEQSVLKARAKLLATLGTPPESGRRAALASTHLQD